MCEGYPSEGQGKALQNRRDPVHDVRNGGSTNDEGGVEFYERNKKEWFSDGAPGTKLGSVPIEVTWGTLGVRRISKKIQWAQLRWFGHIQCREVDHCSRAEDWLEAQGERRWDMPETRWRNTIKADLRPQTRSTDTLEEQRRAWRTRSTRANAKDTVEYSQYIEIALLGRRPEASNDPLLEIRQRIVRMYNVVMNA